MEQESEFIERQALIDLHAAATPELADNLKLQSLGIGSAFVSAAAALPPTAIVINRSLGLGLQSAETEDTIREMVEVYRKAKITRFFIHRHPRARPSEIVDWLTATGLKKSRGWQKFIRGTEPVPRIKTNLTVNKIGPQYAQQFADIACDAFDLGPSAIPWLSQLVERPNWHVFMSFAGDQPAGVGTLFIKDGIGWTDFGATSPKFRCMGSQGAVLAKRIEFALDNGCHQLHTCTGEDVPGDPQHSYKNILKMGFREDYIRENYEPI